MSQYWQDRIANAQAKLSKKTIKQIENQFVRYYRQAAANCVASFEETYNKLMTAQLGGRQPTPADLYKLDTYWQMMAEITKELNKLGYQQINYLNNRFVSHYEKIYNAYAIKGAGTFNTFDKKVAQQIINQIWCADGKTWSARVWTNIQALNETLNQHLISIVAGGKSAKDLKKQLESDFSVSYSRADAIVRTEVAHIQTQAAKQRYEDYGIQQVQIWADEDERRCEECGKLHEKIYPVGAHIPIPAHPRCRCCIVPVIDD